jgi:hemoglobin/transferrin/lactoferrin receptor protein
MRVFFLVLFFLNCLFSVGQSITVKNWETGQGLERATIFCNEPRAFTTTDKRGRADISDFVNCKKIEIRTIGFRTQILSYEEIAARKFVINMQPAVVSFDEIVISASRWSQSSGNVATRVAKVTPKEVAFHNPQTAADLLELSGEVFIQKSQQGGGSPMIRGFSTNRLLYSVDGVRMNTAIFRSGNIHNVISLDAFAIENTEVLFGPGSVTYGSDAIGGVMSFQTLTPTFSDNEKPKFSGALVSRHSTASNEITNHFHLNAGWKKWALLTSVTFSEFGDLRMGANGRDEYLRNFYVRRVGNEDRIINSNDPLLQIPTGYSQLNVMQKLRYKPRKHWDIQYGFHYSASSDIPRYDRLIEIRNDLPRSAEWHYGPQIWMMNNLSINYSKKNTYFDQMTIRFAQQYFQESRIDRGFNQHRLRTQMEEVNAWSANFDFEKKWAKNRLSYGLEYIFNDVQSNASAIDIRDGSSILVPDRYPLSTWSSYAAFLNYQYFLTKKVILQSGVRYSLYHINSDFSRNMDFFPLVTDRASVLDDNVTGSVGLVYRPDRTWKLSANAATGFRAPNVDDIGKIFENIDDVLMVPNVNLSGEYAYNAEVNIAKKIGENFQIDFTGFYTYLDRALVRRAFSLDGEEVVEIDGIERRVFAVQNAAFATVYGFNSGFEWVLPLGFKLTSRYNYQLGNEEMESGEISRSRHAAPAFGVTRLNFTKANLQLQVFAMYSAAVSFDNLNFEERAKPTIYATDENGNPFSPSWFTLNFKSSYRFNKHFEATAGVENIFDLRYRPYSSGLVAPGRNFIFSLRAGF